MLHRLTALLTLVLMLASAGCQSARSVAQQTPPPTPDKPVKAEDGWAKFVTEDTVSDAGLFTTHRNEDKVYFEIPDSLFGRDMLLISRVAKVPANISGFMNAGSKTGENVIRWER